MSKQTESYTNLFGYTKPLLSTIMYPITSPVKMTIEALRVERGKVVGIMLRMGLYWMLMLMRQTISY